MLRLAHLPKRLARKEEKIAEYVDFPASGTTKDQVLSSGYWVHVKDNLKVGDIYEFFPEDNDFYLRARLVQKSPDRLVWQVLQEAQLVSPVRSLDMSDITPYVVENGGPISKWRVLDTSAKPPLEVASGYTTEKAARAEAMRLKKDAE